MGNGSAFMYCQARFAVIAGAVWIAWRMMKMGDGISDGLGRGKMFSAVLCEGKCRCE